MVQVLHIAFTNPNALDHSPLTLHLFSGRLSPLPRSLLYFEGLCNMVVVSPMPSQRNSSAFYHRQVPFCSCLLLFLPPEGTVELHLDAKTARHAFSLKSIFWKQLVQFIYGFKLSVMIKQGEMSCHSPPCPYLHSARALIPMHEQLLKLRYSHLQWISGTVQSQSLRK